MTGATPQDLRGEQLNGVCFVMDYIEFHFNGPILRALEPPVVESAGTIFRSGGSGYRDALCGLVGQSVVEISVADQEAIRLRLDGPAEVTIAIRDARSPSGESAHYVPGAGQPVQVW